MATTTLGNDTLINYQEEVIDNHSIGFQYLSGQFLDPDSENWSKTLGLLLNPDDAKNAGFMYVWDEIKLYEGSNVAFGENSLTPYLGVKSMNKVALSLKINERIGLLEKQLRGGTQSDEAMQSFEMQLLQLKQYIHEIFTIEPTDKDTLVQKGRKKQEIDTNTGGINFNSINHAFQKTTYQK